MPRAKKIKGKRTKIWISIETLERLRQLKRDSENYDSVIRRLLNYYVQGQKKAVVGY